MNFNDLSLLPDQSKSMIYSNIFSKFKPIDTDFEIPNVDKLSGLNSLTVKLRQAQELSQNMVNAMSAITGVLSEYPEVTYLYPYFITDPLPVSESGKLYGNFVQYKSTEIEAELIDDALDNILYLIRTFGYQSNYGKTINITSSDGRIFRLVDYSRLGNRWVLNIADNGEGNTFIRDFVNHSDDECSYHVGTLLFPSNYTRTNDVTPSTVITMIKDLSVNVSTYDMLADLALSLRQNTQSAVSAVMEKYKSMPSLTNAATTFISSFGLGGRKAVIETLKQGLEVAKEAQEDDDGFLNYTDPATFMPKDFLGGIANVLISTVTGIISVIASAVNPIISVCVMIIGSIISKIVEFFQKNVNFKAYLTEGNTSWYPIHCYARDQVTSIMQNISPGTPMYYLIKAGSPIEVIVPGMHMILSTFRANTGVIRHEYFIDTVDRTELLFNRHVFERDGNQVTVDYYNLNEFDDAKMFNPTSNGGELTDEDDQYLRLIIALNLFVAAGFFQNATRAFEFSRFRCTGSDLVCDSVYDHPLADFASTRLSGNLGTIALALEYIQSHQDDPSRGYGLITWERLGYTVEELSRHNLYLASDVDEDYPLFGLGSKDGDALYNIIGENVSDPSVYNYTCTQPVYDDLTSCLMPGRYEKTKTIVQAIGLGVSIAVVAGVSAYVGFKVSRAIKTQKATRMARVEKAYNDFVDNPTKENYNVYRKAVKSNNRFASFFGGTKFSKVNRWDAVGDVASSDSGSGSVSKLASFCSQYYTPDEVISPSEEVSLAGVLTAIVGNGTPS